VFYQSILLGSCKLQIPEQIQSISIQEDIEL
jgi:hypothetical protein